MDLKHKQINLEQFFKNKVELDESFSLIDSVEMKLYSLEDIEKDTKDLLAEYED